MIRSMIGNLKTRNSWCICRTLVFVYQTKTCILGLPYNSQNTMKFQNILMHLSSFHLLSVCREFLYLKILTCISVCRHSKFWRRGLSPFPLGWVYFNNLNYILDLFQVDLALVYVYVEFFWLLFINLISILLHSLFLALGISMLEKMKNVIHVLLDRVC